MKSQDIYLHGFVSFRLCSPVTCAWSWEAFRRWTARRWPAPCSACSERTPRHVTSSWPWSEAERVRAPPPLPKHSDQPSSLMPRWTTSGSAPEQALLHHVCGAVTSVNPSLLFRVFLCVYWLRFCAVWFVSLFEGRVWTRCILKDIFDRTAQFKLAKLLSTKPTQMCLHVFPVGSHLRSIKRNRVAVMREKVSYFNTFVEGSMCHSQNSFIWKHSLWICTKVL